MTGVVMRRDELKKIRPDLVAEYPDGVPGWMIGLPIYDARQLMRLRAEGFALVGIEPGDDPDDLFAREDE